MRVPGAASRRWRAPRLAVAPAHAKSSHRVGMVLAATSSMTTQAPRVALAAAIAMGSVLACSRPSAQPGVVGPALGESTAPGPSDPNALPPDAGPPPEIAGRLHDTRPSGPVPGPTPDTTVGAGSGSATTTPPADNGAAGVVVFPGVATGAAPAATGAPSGIGTAGPNGPGTGNAPATPVGAATGEAPANQPAATNPVNSPAVPTTTPAPVTSPTQTPTTPAPRLPAAPAPTAPSTSGAATSTPGGSQR